jgi:hypothetical protein
VGANLDQQKLMSFFLKFGEIEEGPLGHDQSYPILDSRLLGPTAQPDPRSLGLARQPDPKVMWGPGSCRKHGKTQHS